MFTLGHATRSEYSIGAAAPVMDAFRWNAPGVLWNGVEPNRRKTMPNFKAIIDFSGFPSYSTARMPDTSPPAALSDVRLRQGDLSGSLVARYKPARAASMNEVQTCTGDPDVEANWHNAGLFSGGEATISGITPGNRPLGARAPRRPQGGHGRLERPGEDHGHLKLTIYESTHREGSSAVCGGQSLNLAFRSTAGLWRQRIHELTPDLPLLIA